MRKGKKVSRLLPLIIIFIFVSSILGFILDQNSPEENTDEIELKKTSSGWIVIYNGKEFVFDYNPKDILHSTIKSFNINEDKVYLASNNEEKVKYIFEMLSLNLFNFNIKTEIVKGFNCDKGDKIDLVYLNLTSSNEPLWYIKNNCIFLGGNLNDLSLMKDRFILELLNIQF